MSPRPSRDVSPEIEDALDDRWTREPTTLSRALFYVVLAMLGLVGMARLTGHMNLVHANADLIAMIAGGTGLVWTYGDIRRGVTRFGHQGYWEVRRDEHPVWFRVVTSVYVLGFVILLVGGLAHRMGWIAL